jgi:hypothetical protein
MIYHSAEEVPMRNRPAGAALIIILAAMTSGGEAG